MKDIENHDKDYLNIHQVYQASANELPPQSIDEDILQAAHQAVENDDASNVESISSSAKNTFGVDTQPVRRAWYVPVSYVAMLVISLSVVMKLVVETDTSPMLTEDDYYQSEATMMDQLEHKQLSSDVQRKASPVRSQVTTIDESPLSANAPASSAIAPAPAKSRMKMQSPEVASSETAAVEQQLLYRQKAKNEALAKSKKRVSQAAVMSRDKHEKESLFLAEELDLTSNEMAEEKIEPGERRKKSDSLAGLSQATISERVVELNITEEQQVLIDELVMLFENKQYKILEKKLKEYRKNYPRMKNNYVLPRTLRDWELKNIGKVLQK